MDKKYVTVCSHGSSSSDVQNVLAAVHVGNKVSAAEMYSPKEMNEEEVARKLWLKMSGEQRLALRRSQGGINEAVRYWIARYEAGQPLPIALLSQQEQEMVQARKVEKAEQIKQQHEQWRKERERRQEEEKKKEQERKHNQRERRRLFIGEEKAAGRWLHPIYKTLKQAYADGWRHEKSDEYDSAEETIIKGHRLIRGTTKRAKSKTEWRKSGYAVTVDEEDCHTVLKGQHYIYPVFREDQVGPIAEVEGEKRRAKADQREAKAKERRAKKEKECQEYLDVVLADNPGLARGALLKIIEGCWISPDTDALCELRQQGLFNQQKLDKAITKVILEYRQKQYEKTLYKR